MTYSTTAFDDKSRKDYSKYLLAKHINLAMAHIDLTLLLLLHYTSLHLSLSVSFSRSRKHLFVS